MFPTVRKMSEMSVCPEVLMSLLDETMLYLSCQTLADPQKCVAFVIWNCIHSL